MNILNLILEAQNGAAIRQLGDQFGLQPEQTQSAVAALLPALAAGLQNNMTRDGGLAALASALAGGSHQRYLNDPTSLADGNTIDDGNGILGHVFGSKEVSRQVAQRAADATGIDSGVLKKMLPLIAALAMAALSRQAAADGSISGGQANAGLGSLLGSLLDQNRDGSMMDDVIGMAGKYLGR